MSRSRQSISNTGGLGLMPKQVWKGVMAREQSVIQENVPIGSPETSYSRNIKTAFDGRPSTVFTREGGRSSIFRGGAQTSLDSLNTSYDKNSMPGTAPAGRSPRRSMFQQSLDAQDSYSENFENKEPGSTSPNRERRKRAAKRSSMFSQAKEDKTSNRYSFNSSALRNLKRRDGGASEGGMGTGMGSTRPGLGGAKRTSTAPGSSSKARQGGLRRAGREVDTSLFLDTEVGKLQGQISRLLSEVEKLKVEKEDLQGQLVEATEVNKKKGGVDGASGMLAYKRVKQRCVKRVLTTLPTLSLSPPPLSLFR